MNAGRLDEVLSRRTDFVGYLERRVGSQARAEELFQEVLLRSLHGLAELPRDRPVEPWFFTALRRAAVDEARRARVRARALSQWAREAGSDEAPHERREVTCECLHRARAQLRPEYAEVLQRVSLEGEHVKAFAVARGLSETNGAVRLHRARRALKVELERACGECAEEGCSDCSCS